MRKVSTSISLIQTKLHRPPIYGAHIHRQRLLDQLDQRHKRPLTLISAPAGYGKTVVASCWLEASDSPCAWLSLDETDNDIRLFLSYFLAAIHPCAWLSLDETDNDIRLFLSYFLAAIQTIFPNFGRFSYDQG